MGHYKNSILIRLDLVTAGASTVVHTTKVVIKEMRQWWFHPRATIYYKQLWRRCTALNQQKKIELKW